MSDITKTMDEIFDESFDSTGHLRRIEVVDNAMKAWRAGVLTLDPDHVRRVDIINEVSQTWSEGPSDGLTHSEAQPLIVQAVDHKMLELIEKEVDVILKERAAIPEDIEWFLSRITV